MSDDKSLPGPRIDSSRNRKSDNSNVDFVDSVSTAQNISDRIRSQKSSRSSEERFRQIFEHAPTGIAITDLEGRFLHCNEAYRAIVGYETEELFQLDFAKLVHPDDRAKNLKLIRRLEDNEIPSFELENRYVRKNGDPVWVNKFVSVLRDENGKPSDLIALVTDITARREAELSVANGERLMRAILKTAADAIITFDREGVIESINPATETMFGYSADELIGKNIDILMPSPHWEIHDRYMARFVRNDKSPQIGIGREFFGRRRNGSKFPVELAVSQVDGLELYAAIIRECTERVELQKQILEIVAIEDQRIGAELHDNIQQKLTGLGLLATSLADRMEQQSLSQSSEVQRIAQGINEINNDVHLLARGLVPVEVDAEGLRSSLVDLARRVGVQYNVECNFQGIGNVEVSDNFVATHLFRITQEAINNAVKHGKPDRIEISLIGDEFSIELMIHDNGIGVGPNLSFDDCGMGLRIMAYRAELIGATIQVIPGIDVGTDVKCEIFRDESD